MIGFGTTKQTNALDVDNIFQHVKNHKKQIYNHISDAMDTVKAHFAKKLIHDVKTLSSIEIFKIYRFSKNTALFVKLSHVLSGTVDQIVHDIIAPIKNHDTGLAQDCLEKYHSMKQDLIPANHQVNQGGPKTSRKNTKAIQADVKQLLELCNFDEIFNFLHEKAKPFIMLSVFTLLEKVLEAYQESSDNLLELVGELADNKLNNPEALKADFITILQNQFTQHLSDQEINTLTIFFKSSAWKKLKNNADKLNFSELLDKITVKFPASLRKTIKTVI